MATQFKSNMDYRRTTDVTTDAALIDWHTQILQLPIAYVLLDQGVFVAVLPAHPCQNVRVAMWVRTGSLRPLAPTQQPAQVVLSEQSDKSDITESTIRLIRVCQSVPELAPRLQLLK